MRVVYKNIEVDIDENMTVYDAFTDAIKEQENVIACLINNEVKSLNYVLKENDEVEFIDKSSRDGARIYTRGLLFVMSMAFKKLYPDIKLTVNYQLKSSMICELQDMKMTREMLNNVRKKCRKL